MVNTVVIRHPVVLSVNVMVVGPVCIPVTVPDREPTVPLAKLLLLHVPVGSVSVSVMLDPTHTAGEPLIVGGKGFTVTVTAAEAPQPVV